MSKQQLIVAIERELLELQRLVVLLEQEQNALVQRRIDQVSALLEAKSQAVRVLEAASETRSAVSAELGLTGQTQLLAFLGEDSKLWQQVQQSARMAEMLNKSNGQLIQTHQESSQHLMSLLAQQRNLDSGYSADGKFVGSTGLSRPLDQA